MSENRGQFKDSIRRALIAHSLTPVALITFLCFGLIFFFWNKTTIEQTISANRAISQVLAECFSDYMDVSHKIIQQNTVADLVGNVNSRAAAYNELYSFVNNYPVRADFYVLDRDMQVILSSDKSATQHPLTSSNTTWGATRQLTQKPMEAVFYSDTQTSDNQIVDMYLTVGRAIMFGPYAEGYVLFLFKGTDILRQLNPQPALTVIADRYNHVLASNTALFQDYNGRVSQSLKSSRGYFQHDGDIFFSSPSVILNGKVTVYTVTQVSSILSAAAIVGVLLILTFVLLSITILISAKRISDSKTAIIGVISTAFEEAGRGNLDYQLYIATNDEFERIGEAYTIMLTRMKRLIALNEERARETVISELRHLESQFNPHFLYNTLETIRYMAKPDPQTTSDMILWLAHLLRYSINDRLADVTLAEDIEHTQNYLRIQKLRFGNALHYEISVEPQAEDCIVPKLIVQPLIENSIKHGFGPEGRLFIKLSTAIEGDQLVISILDNGTGISPKKLEQLRESLSHKQQHNENIGLYNVNRRIRLMYGDDYGLLIDSPAGIGACVVLRLPVRRRSPSPPSLPS